MALTSKQKRVRDFLWEFVADSGMPPEYSQIMDGTGVPDVSKVLFSLKLRGHVGITKIDGKTKLEWIRNDGADKVWTYVIDPVTGQYVSRDELADLMTQRVERKCMCCGGLFLSVHKFNRMCRHCNADAVESGFGHDPYSQGYISNAQAIQEGWVGGFKR